jgi:hypothetical protein
MERVFDELMNLASNPFAQLAAQQNALAWLASQGLSPAEATLALDASPRDLATIAAGPFQPTETCWDPGPDPAPDPAPDPDPEPNVAPPAVMPR